MTKAQIRKILRRRRIAVLAGGTSSEREVSLRSGANVAAALRSLGLDVTKIDPAKDLPAALRKLRIDLVFPAVHGTQAEDGVLQGVLDYLGIPYAGSGVLASAIGMDKIVTKRLLAQAGIPTPEWREIRDPKKDLRAALSLFRFPAVAKPVAEGSSVGVRILRDPRGVDRILEQKLRRYGRVFLERYVRGAEVTAGVVEEKGRFRSLPVLELVPHREFYDYEAKYTKGLTDFILPARLSASVTRLVQRLATAASELLGCRGMARVDFVVEGKKRPFVLEVNTIPGFTETSDLPAMARAAGIRFPELVGTILCSALEGRA
jgi:D-alanine-D-alanine ligase